MPIIKISKNSTGEGGLSAGDEALLDKIRADFVEDEIIIADADGNLQGSGMVKADDAAIIAGTENAMVDAAQLKEVSDRLGDFVPNSDIEQLDKLTQNKSILLTAGANTVKFGYDNRVHNADFLANGWVQSGGIAGSVILNNLINENVFSKPDGSSGATSDYQFTLDGNWWDQARNGNIDIFFDLDISRGRENIWFGFSAATSAALTAAGKGFDGVTGRGGFRFVVGQSGDNDFVSFLDGTAGNVNYTSNENGFNVIHFHLAQGSSIAQIYANDLLLGDLPVVALTHSYFTDRMTIGSGSSSSTDELIQIRSIDIRPNTLPLTCVITRENFEENNVIVIPQGSQNYSINLPSLLCTFGSSVEVKCYNTGTVTINDNAGAAIKTVESDGSLSIQILQAGETANNFQFSHPTSTDVSEFLSESDVIDVINQQSYILLYVDSAMSDDSGDGLTQATAFRTIKAAIDSTPKNSLVKLTLVAGSTYEIDQVIDLFSRKVVIDGSANTANRPILIQKQISNSSNNYECGQFVVDSSSYLLIIQCQTRTVTFDTAKTTKNLSDIALVSPKSSSHTMSNGVLKLFGGNVQINNSPLSYIQATTNFGIIDFYLGNLAITIGTGLAIEESNGVLIDYTGPYPVSYKVMTGGNTLPSGKSWEDIIPGNIGNIESNVIRSNRVEVSDNRFLYFSGLVNIGSKINNIVNFSAGSDNNPEWILITTNANFATQKMIAIEIECAGMLGNVYTVISKVEIGHYFFENQIFTPYGLLTTSASDSEREFIITSNNGRYAYAIKSSTFGRAMVNFIGNQAGVSVGFSDDELEGWTASKITKANLDALVAAEQRSYTGTLLQVNTSRNANSDDVSSGASGALVDASQLKAVRDLIRADGTGDAIPLAQKGAGNGVMSLGADAKAPIAQLPISTAADITNGNQDTIITAAQLRSEIDSLVVWRLEF